MKILIILISLILTQNSYANEKCRVIKWQENHIYNLNGSLNKATHIIFPVQKAVDPVVGNRELWLVESQANHVFFKPTNREDQDGVETTLTFIGQNNKSYQFNLIRQEDSKVNQTCVVIQDQNELLNKSWVISKTKLNQALKLNAYRSQIYTGDPIINSAYDDGRWTYIRLNQNINTAYSLYGIADKQKILLEYQYDEFNHLYQISGIYSELILALGNQEIHITRN